MLFGRALLSPTLLMLVDQSSGRELIPSVLRVHAESDIRYTHADRTAGSAISLQTARHIRDARLDQRLGGRENCLAAKFLAGAEVQLLDFFLERPFCHNCAPPMMQQIEP